MKRIGHLLERIADPDNLRLAFCRAAKAKRAQNEVRLFQAGLDEWIPEMRRGILEGTFPVGHYRRFTVFDPKERVIHAATFPERVLHHAILNMCEPVFERLAIHDSYACRPGKGRLAAIERARAFAAEHGWFLKLDIRKYFDSVDQEVLLGMLERRFKDPGLLRWFRRIIGAYRTQPGKGLPIGSLTSQHLANFYLGALDRFVKEELRRGAYLRYMDDSVIWGTAGAELREVLGAVEGFVADRLHLGLKGSPFINRTALGMDFLGFRVYPHTIRLNRRSRRRFVDRVQACERAHGEGRLTERQLQNRVEALVAFTAEADAAGFRRAVLARFGAQAEGLEPRDPRRQLEERSEQLPGREPQQERAVEPERQLGFPARPSSVRTRDGLRLTRPASRPEAPGGDPAKAEWPPGAGSPSRMAGSNAPGGRTAARGAGEESPC
jgi:hypothetical protein